MTMHIPFSPHNKRREKDFLRLSTVLLCGNNGPALEPDPGAMNFTILAEKGLHGYHNYAFCFLPHRCWSRWEDMLKLGFFALIAHTWNGGRV